MTPSEAYTELMSRLHEGGEIDALELEQIIATDAFTSYMFAAHILYDRFEMGEEAISKHPLYSFLYSKYILCDRFEIGEGSIAKKGKESYWYATEVLGKRFEMGEEAIGASMYKDEYNEYFRLGHKIHFPFVEG